MIPRRDEEGWREIGPLVWRVDRQDNHGDRSTTTGLFLAWAARWSFSLNVTRPWRDEPG